MEQQQISSANSGGLHQLKTRVQHLRADASNALHAARHDYEQLRDAVRKLNERSELKAFIQTRLHNGNGTATAKPRRKKAAAAPASAGE